MKILYDGCLDFMESFWAWLELKVEMAMAWNFLSTGIQI